MLGMARRGLARHGEGVRNGRLAGIQVRALGVRDRVGGSWQGRPRRGSARLGMARQGSSDGRPADTGVRVLCAHARHGQAVLGTARHGKARDGRLADTKVRVLGAHGAQRHEAGHGTAVLAPAGLGMARNLAVHG